MYSASRSLSPVCGLMPKRPFGAGGSAAEVVVCAPAQQVAAISKIDALRLASRAMATGKRLVKIGFTSLGVGVGGVNVGSPCNTGRRGMYRTCHRGLPTG